MNKIFVFICLIAAVFAIHCDPHDHYCQAGNDLRDDMALKQIIEGGLKNLGALLEEQREFVHILKEKETAPSTFDKFVDKVSTGAKNFMEDTKETISNSIPVGRLFKSDGLEFFQLTPMQNKTIQLTIAKENNITIRAPAFPQLNNASYIGNMSFTEIFGVVNSETKFVFHNNTLNESIVTLLLSGEVKLGRVTRTLPKLVVIGVVSCTSSVITTIDFCKPTTSVLRDTVASRVDKETYKKVSSKPDSHQAVIILKDKKDLWPKVSGALMNPSVTQVYIETDDKQVLDLVAQSKGLVDVGDDIKLDLDGVELLVYVKEPWFKDSGFVCPMITDERVFSVYSGRKFIGNGAVDNNGDFVTVAHIFALNGLQIGSKFYVCNLGKSYEYLLAKWDFSLELAAATPINGYPSSNLIFDFDNAPGVVDLHGSYYGESEFRHVSLGRPVVEEEFQGRTVFIAHYAAWQGMSGSPAIATPKKGGKGRVVAFHSYGTGISFAGGDIKVYLVPFVPIVDWNDLPLDMGEWYDRGIVDRFFRSIKSLGGYHTVDDHDEGYIPPRPQSYHTHEREEMVAIALEWSIIVIVAIAIYRLAHTQGSDSVNVEMHQDNRLQIMAKAADAGVLGLPSALYYGSTGFVYAIGRFCFDHPVMTLVLGVLMVCLEYIGVYEYQTVESGMIYRFSQYGVRMTLWWLTYIIRFPHAFCGIALARQDIQSFFFIQLLLNIPVAWIAWSFGYHDGRMWNVKVRQDATLSKDLAKYTTLGYKAGSFMQTVLLITSVCAVVVGTRLFNLKATPHSTGTPVPRTGAVLAASILGLSIILVGYNLTKTIVMVDWFGSKKDFVKKIKDELPTLIGGGGDTKVFVLDCSLKYKKVLQSSDDRRLLKLIDLLNDEEIPTRKPTKAEIDSNVKFTSNIDVTKLILDIQHLMANKVWSISDENNLCMRASRLFQSSEEIQEACRKLDGETNHVKQVVPTDVDNDVVSQVVMTFAYFFLSQQTPIVLLDRVFIPFTVSAILAFATMPLKEWLLTYPFRQESDLAAYYVRFAVSLGMVVVTAPQNTDEQVLSVLNWEKINVNPPYITVYSIQSVFVVGFTFLIPMLYPVGMYNTITIWDEVFEQVIVYSIVVILLYSGLIEKINSIYNRKFGQLRKSIGLIPFRMPDMNGSLEIVDYKVKRGGRSERQKRRQATNNGAGVDFE